MVDLYIQDIMKGLLLFLRIGAILFVMPYFGDKIIPVKVRLLLGLALTIFVHPLAMKSWPLNEITSIYTYSMLALQEVGIGITVGFISKMIFEGAIMAAGLVGYQMGFGTANLMVPGTDEQMNAFTAFHRSVVLLTFLGLNLHFLLINGITETFNIIPTGSTIPSSNIADYMIHVTSQIFVIALQLSTPILIALLLTMAGLGLIARTVPQMNVFTMSFPLSFFIGLATYFASAKFYPQWFQTYYYDQTKKLFEGLIIIGP